MKANRITFLLVLLLLILISLLSAYQVYPGPIHARAARSNQQAANSICYAIADSGGGPPGNDLLTQVDFDLGLEIAIGPPGTNNMEAIAFQASTGILFGADAGQLGTLDLTNGSFTAAPNPFGSGDGALGPISLTDADGLAFDPSNGFLYASHRRSGGTNADLLFRADPATGLHVENAFGLGIDYVVIQPNQFYDIDDIAIDPVDNQMYAIANNGGAGDRLVKVDKLTGATIDIGALGVNDMEGLTFDPTGQLLGTTGKDGPVSTNNKLYRIDKNTAVANVSTAKLLTAGSDYEGVDCLISWPAIPTPTPTPTDTPTPTPTTTPQPTPTNTPTPTPTVPTAVKLLYFRVEMVQVNQVTLKWATASEIDNYGFKIYRSSVDDFQHAEMIGFKPAIGGIHGATYSFTDFVTGTRSWLYWLVDVDTRGQETVHGPVISHVVNSPSSAGSLIFLPLVIQP